MNDLLKRAEKWLNELSIQTVEGHNCLMVSKKDMLIIGSEQLPDVAFDFILKELRSALGTNKFYWNLSFSGSDYLCLESF
jgi:hypothetical protein